MERIKCITFDKAAQDNLPQELKDKMKADRLKAQKEQENKGLNISRVSNSVCGSIRHKMMLAGIYKECPACGEKFKETDC